ncbi:MAG: hypothetical protein LW669_01870 [Sphingobacteriales bacterium]|jgi:hypothetical protein|nr:hypothetical protein [Sphingobacteriales bacterium]
MCHWRLYFKNRIIFILFVLLLSEPKSLLAQEQIVFFHEQKGKIIQAKLGDQLSIKYRGYLGQTENFKQTLTEIKDSSFVLGYSLLGPDILLYKEIKYSDILAFRRIGLGSVILKTTLSLGSAVGAIFLLDRTYKNNDFNLAGRIGISVGLGVGMNLIINSIFPDKPKYQVKEGWKVYPIIK